MHKGMRAFHEPGEVCHGKNVLSIVTSRLLKRIPNGPSTGDAVSLTAAPWQPSSSSTFYAVAVPELCLDLILESQFVGLVQEHAP